MDDDAIRTARARRQHEDEAAKQRRQQRQREDLLAGLRLETRLAEANPPTPARAAQERTRRHDRISALLRDADAGVPDASYIDDETAALLRAELARLERSGARPLETDVVAAPLLAVGRANTILYCRDWSATVSFYSDDLGLAILAENEWYVEFRVTTASSISIADSTKAPITDVGGQGITLSWRVPDLVVTHKRLVDHGLGPSRIRPVGGASAFYLYDPEGHRIEIWSERA